MSIARALSLADRGRSTRSPSFRVARTRSAVSIVLPAPIARESFRRVRRDEFVEDRAFAGPGTEDSPEPLYVLADGAAARKDDRDVRVGDVDTLVQDLGRDDDSVPPVGKARQELAPLAHFRLMSDRGDQEPP